MDKIWFKAKRYGYGWYPCTWQGWLVLAAYVAIFSVLISIFESDVKKFLWPYLISVFLLTSALIYICYKKGEPAKWRWGDKK